MRENPLPILLLLLLLFLPFSCEQVPTHGGSLWRQKPLLSRAEASETSRSAAVSNRQEGTQGGGRLAALEAQTDARHLEGEEPFFETEYYLQSWRNPAAFRRMLLQTLLLAVANLILFTLKRRRERR